jgi:hypothetical protein
MINDAQVDSRPPFHYAFKGGGVRNSVACEVGPLLSCRPPCRVSLSATCIPPNYATGPFPHWLPSTPIEVRSYWPFANPVGIRPHWSLTSLAGVRRL